MGVVDNAVYVQGVRRPDPLTLEETFETMRAGMVRDLMAPGNRSLPERKDGDFALDLGSASPAGGQ